MSSLSDSCKSVSNMDFYSISGDYNATPLAPTAPEEDERHHLGTPPTGSRTNLYPTILRSNRNPSVRPDSTTPEGFVIVRESSLPVRDEYAADVYRVGEVSYSKQKVMGMVFVSPFLYVLHRGSDILYKCNTAPTQSGAFLAPPMSSHRISGLLYPRGMAVNNRTKHLYITDRRSSKGRLVKVSLSGVVVVADVDLPGLEPFGVSVGPSNEGVIVACCKHPHGVLRTPIFCSGYIAIFEDTGARLRELRLIALAESVQMPRHVLEAPRSSSPGAGKEYLVVHGWVRVPGIDSDHQVSRVNVDGRVVRSFGVGCGAAERHLNRPMSVTFDDVDKLFVADSFNDRVLLLNGSPSDSYDLQLVRPLVTSANGLTRPRHVCHDREKRLLYVGKDSGGIDVFYVGKGPLTTTTAQ